MKRIILIPIVFALLSCNGQNPIDTVTIPTSPNSEISLIPTGLNVLPVTDVTDTSATVSWPIASRSSTESLPANVNFKVVYSRHDNISTVSDAETNGMIAKDWSTTYYEWWIGEYLCKYFKITGLREELQYYVTVIVRDASGNKSVYQMKGFTTIIGGGPPSSDRISPTTGTLSYESLSLSGVRINWTQAGDNVTPSNQLLYKVIYSKNNNYVGNMMTAESLATMAMNWIANVNTKLVQENMDQGATYYFAVIVKDQAGNKTLYPYISFALPDTTPLNAGTMSVEKLSLTNYKIKWTPASDNGTPNTQLEYNLLYSKDICWVANLSTINKAGTWTGLLSNIYEKEVYLDRAGTYYIAVVVKDKAGNQSLYPYKILIISSSDTTPPTLPAYNQPGDIIWVEDGAITSNIKYKTATDNVDTKIQLRYYLYYSTNYAHMLTINTVLQYATKYNGYHISEAGSATWNVFYIGVLRYFRLIVEDRGGNKTMYPAVTCY